MKNKKVTPPPAKGKEKKNPYSPWPSPQNRVSSPGNSAISSARRKKSAKKIVKQHQAREYHKIFLKQPHLSTTIISPTFSFQEVTTELAKAPQRLELHPMKTAPSLYEVENRMTREKEAEKLKFFSVPIKIYEPDPNTGVINLQNVPYTEQDQIDLGRYGARVIMTDDGRVAAVEVDKDLIKNQFQKKKLHGEICQCEEVEYEISDELRNDEKVRRYFMAKVLAVEILMRVPALITMYYQQHSQELHDFLYQQNLLLTLLIIIIQGTRLAGVYFSDIGRYEPCRSIIASLTIAGHCMISALTNSLLEKYSILYIDYLLFEDPTSLATLSIKRKKSSGKKVSYPYAFSLMIAYLAVMNGVIILILIFPKRIMNELGNIFIFIHIITCFLLTMFTYYLIYYLRVAFLSRYFLGWDSTQLMFALLFTSKWAVWRHYMLRQLVKGRVMKVHHENYVFVALNFAI